MPKMKSKRALMKRIKVTGSGNLKIKHAYNVVKYFFFKR